jgi:hypothetical protein
MGSECALLPYKAYGCMFPNICSEHSINIFLHLLLFYYRVKITVAG